jgi:ribulose-5-phosphate 4-epimerase/fuculose-1-phosphate aldolase
MASDVTTNSNRNPRHERKMSMSELDELKRDLVRANRILAKEGIVDAWGHISVRNPDNPETYFLSRSRSPGLVTMDDLIEFNLDNTPVKPTETPLYIERPIHGMSFQARPDVQSVIHHHCQEILPFAVTGSEMRPAIASTRVLGGTLPVWDITDKFGDTDFLVTTNDQGRDLSTVLGRGRAVIMRSHGATVAGATIANAVDIALAMKRNAVAILDGLKLGPIKYLTEGQLNFVNETGQRAIQGHDRAWEYLCQRAGVTKI